MTNMEVSAIVFEYYQKNDADGAAEQLLREAVARWRLASDDIIDDITCLVIFLDTEWLLYISIFKFKSKFKVKASYPIYEDLKFK